MGVPTGGNVGAAVGHFQINTTQAQQAVPVARAIAQGINQAMTGVNAGAKRAEASFDSMSGSLQQFAGVFGVSLGVGAVAQMGRFALEADKIATAYGRQLVAARGMAGSQAQLNDLLRVYERATGGAVDKAASLANVTKLMAVGFADSSVELNQFARAIRGISVAMGQSQDTVTQNLILELFTQRGMRLDQLGLQYDKVRARADELAAADNNLTDQMAYQQAVLEQANERFGRLADSAEGAKTGIERLGVAWTDLQLTLGQTSQSSLSGFFNFWAIGLERVAEAIDEIDRKQQRINWRMQGLNPDRMEYAVASDDRAQNAATQGASVRAGRARAAAIGRVSPEERQVHLDWAQGINDLNTRVHGEILDAERDFGRNRADTVANYNKSVAREERDFGRARLRAELDQLDAIADIHKAAARRESDLAEDLARTISESISDSDDRVANARKDAGERLIEIEEDYAKDRARAEEDHRDNLLSAAGRLDAIAILEERKRWNRESKDAKDAHDEQRDDLNKQLDERIDDERESLAKSIRQANEAAQRQLEDARENDRLRLQEMKDDFAKRKAQEDEDRAIRKQDQAQDHADQLLQMDRAHVDRIAQIRENAAAERRALQDAADAELVRLGEADKAARKRVEAKEKHLEAMWDKFHKHIEDSLTPGPEPLDGANRGKRMTPMASGGYVPRDMAAWLHRGEVVIPAPMVAAASGMGGGSRGPISIGEISISIAGTTDMGAGELRPMIYEVLVDALEQVAGRR